MGWLLTQILGCLLYILFYRTTASTLRYSVYEDLEKGFVVSNMANDLGLDPKILSSRRGRVVFEGETQYFQINTHDGSLLVNERIDRERICGQSQPCLLYFQLILEDPLRVYGAETEILDLNDNPPRFPKTEYLLEINEMTVQGTRFPLENAQDLDVGIYAIQNYHISPSEYFRLNVYNASDSRKRVELVLVKQLDYEKTHTFNVQLIATDGGKPQKTGSARIRIVVLDANDNEPVFSQSTYKVKLLENNAQGSIAVKVTATDVDVGTNGEILYYFGHVSDKVSKLFSIHERTGEITVSKSLDYEKEKNYQLEVQAKDGGGLTAHCEVIVETIDVNDNAPEVIATSFTSPIPENSPLQTVIALLSVRDQDSGENGKVRCFIADPQPFKLLPSVKNFYELVTDALLDREDTSEYNITITAEDSGSPPLSATTTIHLKISDINDNPPIFKQQSNAFCISENNNPGALIGVVNAFDMDSENNARIHYSVIEKQIQNLPLSHFISINSDSGGIYAMRSLDYEQVTQIEFAVNAQDSGFPALNNSAIIKVLVLDKNDNTPMVLHPLLNASSSAEMVPLTAEEGHLITKVVAVDADSGQNAWLSFHLLKATDPSLFEVALQSGEIRTTRRIQSKDINKHKLVVGIKDNGQPPLTSTVTLNLLIAERFSDAYLKHTDLQKQEEADPSLLTYLIISVSVISLLFLVLIIILVVVKCHRIKNRKCQTVDMNVGASRAIQFPTGFLEKQNTGTIHRGYLSGTNLTTDSNNHEVQICKTNKEDNLAGRGSHDFSHLLIGINTEQQPWSWMNAEHL
ncbi:protocadherin beta-15-like isoform X1 [Protopterus annectens]|uniref:protocadherin beta-15-like isoform X1 n=1 Tax=Protopterus annectens TaxID=7888 RepID=UPI001CFC4627|nr:protocadherin beta-15-like isoform X1 [Protopterus annectens]